VPFYGGGLVGCVTGGLAGGVGGTAVGGPPGGGGGFLAGCTVGAFAGMEASLPESVATMFVTGGATYLWESWGAKNDLQADMAACSQIP
jgi:hypothetical protein